MSEADPGLFWKARFFSIFFGQALSLIGSAVTQFVLMWWITDTTKSVSALGTAAMTALLPQALLGPLAGTCADRYSRRTLMISADLISAICMLAMIVLLLSNRIELWHVYSMMFVRSSMQAFQAPAAAASTAMLVPAGFLPKAAGLNQMLHGLTIIAAAPLGALAMGLMPISFALGIDVITALLGIAPLLIFRVPQLRSSQPDKTSLWIEFREGVRIVSRNAGLMRIYALLGAVVLVIMPLSMFTPLLVREYFSGGAKHIALMEGLSGVGLIVGGLAITALAPKRPMQWVLWGFAVSCFAVALTALVPADTFWFAVIWWVVSGIAVAVGFGPLTVLLQMTIPNHYQGRIFSLLSTVMGLAAPLGLAIATPLGELIGIRWLFVVLGALGGCLSLAGFLSPSLLRLDVQEVVGGKGHGR